jgi:hypothetical protein
MPFVICVTSDGGSTEHVDSIPDSSIKTLGLLDSKNIAFKFGKPDENGNKSRRKGFLRGVRGFDVCVPQRVVRGERLKPGG